MWRFRSLLAQLNIIFLSFLLLVGGSVTATYVAMQAQSDDARVINLAGRQRMLTQKMVWLALAQPESTDLQATIQLFDRTLVALRDGGITLDALGREITLPPAPNSAIRDQLDEVAQTWSGFQRHLRPVDGPALQAAAPLILSQIDAVVSEFEIHAQAKLGHVRLIQFVFLIMSLLLLAWGYLVTRRRIAKPLTALGTVARQIARGDFSSPLPSMRADELGDLGGALEAMRSELATAHDNLETRVARRTRELVSALEFSQEIVAQLDVDRLLRSVTDRARDLVQAHDASLCLLTADGAHLEVAASTSEQSVQLRQSTQNELTAQVVGRSRVVTAETTCVTCRFIQNCAPGQYAAAPLQIGDRILGALCTVRSGGPAFDPDELRAISLLANSAAIAITNARLAKARQQQASQAASLAERERLAADLHDNLAQTLSFLNFKVDQIEALTGAGSGSDTGKTLQQMKSVITTAYGQVRSALVDLREPSIAGHDFAEKLAACVAEFREAAGCAVELSVDDPALLELPRTIQMQSLHIVREALTNARRHANARHVRVCVARVDGQVRFTVADDGCGFDPLAVEGGNHLGLTIMRTRAERSGGGLIIESAPGTGTKVIASFPAAGSYPGGKNELLQENER